jgi:hypothetical protein
MTAMAEDVWAEGVKRLHAEARGVIHFYLIQPTDALALIGSALAGDALAGRISQAISATVQQIRRAPQHAPALCLTCPPALPARFLVCLAAPARDDPSNALGSGKCLRCASDRASLLSKIGEAYRGLWPDARVVAVTHPMGGCA